MKTALITFGFALGAMTGAALAQDVPFSGYVSLGAVQSTNDNYEFETNYNPWRGLDFGAAVSFDMSGGKSIDLELRNFSQGDAYYSGYYVTSGQLATAGYNVNNGALGYGGFAGLYVSKDYYEEGADNNLILGGKLSYAMADKVSLFAQVGDCRKLQAIMIWVG